MNISELLQKLTIRVNRQGSGILFLHPNDPHHYYIFTAHHCIEPNPNFCLVEYIQEDGNLKTIIVDNKSFFIDPKNDFALLLINKSDFHVIESTIPSINIGRIYNDNTTYHFRGYPAALLGEATKLEAKFIEASEQGFKIRTITSLSDSSGDLAASSVAGFSGSGVVVEMESKLVLVGIVTHLGNPAGSFNQVHCCSFAMINQLFSRYNLPELKIEDVEGNLENETTEILYSSLLKVDLPVKVFIGEINTTRKELLEYGRKESKFIPYQMDNRQFVYELLKMKGLRLSGDFAISNNKLIVFYDLTQSDNSFHYIVDPGTVESIDINEYCANADRQHTFVSLLNTCLMRKLHHMGIAWKHEDRTYIFSPEDEILTKRQIKWKGKVKTERTVFEAKMHSKTNPDEPDKLWHCTHFAFQCNFRQFGDEWFLNIIPDAFATHDGKKKHFWKTKELATYKKKKERNGEVFTHVRFLAYYLSQNKDNFLKFDELASFDNAPKLTDDYWHIKKEKKQS